MIALILSLVWGQSFPDIPKDPKAYQDSKVLQAAIPKVEAFGRAQGGRRGEMAGVNQATDDADGSALSEGQLAGRQRADAEREEKVRNIHRNEGQKLAIQNIAAKVQKEFSQTQKLVPRLLLEEADKGTLTDQKLVENLSTSLAKIVVDHHADQVLGPAVEAAKQAGVAEGEKRAESEVEKTLFQKFREQVLLKVPLSQQKVYEGNFRSRIYFDPLSQKSTQFFQPIANWPHQTLKDKYLAAYEKAFLERAAAMYDEHFPKAKAILKAGYERAAYQETKASFPPLVRDQNEVQRYADRLMGQFQTLFTNEITTRVGGKSAQVLASAKSSAANAAYSKRKLELEQTWIAKKTESLKTEFSGEFVGFSLEDENEDRVFAPGEAVFVNVIIKNFSQVNSRLPLTLVVEGPGNQKNRFPLQNSIPPQSETLVARAAHVFLPELDSPDFANGKVEFRVQLLENEQPKSAFVAQKVTIELPLTAQLVVPKNLLAEAKQSLQVRLVNRSSKPWVPTGAVASVEGTPMTLDSALPTLPAGGSGQISFSGQMPKTLAYRKVTFRARVQAAKAVVASSLFTVSPVLGYSKSRPDEPLFIIPGDTQNDLAQQVVAGTGFNLFDTSVATEDLKTVSMDYLDAGVVLSDRSKNLDPFLAAGGAVWDLFGAVPASRGNPAENYPGCTQSLRLHYQSEQSPLGLTIYQSWGSTRPKDMKDLLRFWKLSVEQKVAEVLRDELNRNGDLAAQKRCILTTEIADDIYRDAAANGTRFTNSQTRVQTKLARYVNSVGTERRSFELVSMYGHLRSMVDQRYSKLPNFTAGSKWGASRESVVIRLLQPIEDQYRVKYPADWRRYFQPDAPAVR